MNETNKTTSDLLSMASDRAIRYLSEIGNRAVAPSKEAVERLSFLGGAMPEEPTDPADIISMLDVIVKTIKYNYVKDY